MPSECILLKGGGGADLDVVTASASNILTGKVIVDKDGNPLTGTMPDNTGTALTVATNGKTLIPKGYHDGTQYATNTQATMAGGTKAPTTSQQTIACKNKYMTSDIVIPAFSLPAASSIKKGVKVTIYGKSVTGTFEGYVSDNLYIFNNGTWSNISTTGLRNGTISGNIINVDGLGRTNATVDLTNYNYVKIYYNIGDDDKYWYKVIGIGVSTSSSLISADKCTKYIECDFKGSGYGTGILDVSSLSGKYYIYLTGWYDLKNGTIVADDLYIGKIYLSRT